MTEQERHNAMGQAYETAAMAIRDIEVTGNGDDGFNSGLETAAAKCDALAADAYARAKDAGANAASP